MRRRRSVDPYPDLRRAAAWPPSAQRSPRLPPAPPATLPSQSALGFTVPSYCAPRRGHPHGDHDTVLGDLDPIDEDRQQVQLAEITPEQLGQLLLGALNKRRETADFEVASGSTSPIGSRPAG